MRSMLAMPVARACAALAPLLALARADAPAGPLMQALAQQFPDAPGQALADALQSALQVEGVPLAEAACERDYGAPCPLGWVDAGDGGTCSAPLGYDGPCLSLDLRGLPADEKMRAAAQCDAVFPCVAGCTADYSKPCPGDWVETEEGSCVAPMTYIGPCVGRMDFRRMGAHGKAAFANSCGVRWPCRRPLSRVVARAKDCAIDFTASCPEGWSVRRGLCVAPADYVGPCPAASSLSDYTEAEKTAFARACGASWPCAA